MAGDSPAALRCFSLLATLLLTVPFALLAVSSLGPRTGLFALVLVLFSPALFWYSVEVRMYALTTLFVATAAFYLQRLVAGPPRPRDGLLFAISSTLAFYTHYFNLFVIAGMVICWLLSSWRRASQRRAALVATAIVLVLTGPWLPIVVEQQAQTRARAELLEATRRQPESLNYGNGARPQYWLQQGLLATQDIASLLGVYPGE